MGCALRRQLREPASSAMTDGTGRVWREDLNYSSATMDIPGLKEECKRRHWTGNRRVGALWMGRERTHAQINLTTSHVRTGYLELLKEPLRDWFEILEQTEHHPLCRLYSLHLPMALS